ncbi:class I adenylate-forming enzyme family protein [Novosphingobium bradum]|uniref:Class I adenylate-forming enzyme family protein n=1 Tax=Novosphingobium bradum TaxID=1737444 RepID=A0ABV7IMA8_9SPHN
MSKLAELVNQIFSLDPAAPAAELDGQWWSWGDLAAIGQALERQLAANGLGKDARVAGMLKNRPEMAGALVHVLASGRCLVTLNPSLPDDRLCEDIRTLKPGAIFGLESDWARAGVIEAARETGCLGLVLTTDRADPVRVVDGLGKADLGKLRPFAENDVAVEMLTSGTTGTPKRIPLQRRSIEQSVLGAAVYDGRKQGEPPRLRDQVVLVNAPFTHIAGIFGLMNAIMAGRKVAVLPRFTVEGWVGAVERHGLKVASAPPAALRMILDANVAKERLASLSAFRTGTAPLDPDLADAFYERYGIPVLQNYSATEFAGAGAGWTLSDYKAHYPAKRGSVGRINPGLEARTVDVETLAPLARGEQGLLELRAPHLGNGDWMRTTDLAVIDADDFLYIKGRADNAIIRGGFKVFPEDVVKAMQDHPAIREAAVIGLPDERLGQVPAAAYLIKAGATAPSDGELREFLKKGLLAYQVPTYIFLFDELPRTPSMKVAQPALKAALAERIAQASVSAG